MTPTEFNAKPSRPRHLPTDAQHVGPGFSQVGGRARSCRGHPNLSEAELMDLLPDFDGWIIGDDPATHQVFEAGRGVFKAAVKWGIGVDGIDFKACDALGIPSSIHRVCLVERWPTLQWAT